MVLSTHEQRPNWTLEENSKLLELWKSENNWQDSSIKMHEAFPTREKDFFAPNICRKEFQMIIQAPAPIQIENTAQSNVLSLNELVDIWINHYRKEQYEQEIDESLLEIRSSYALIDRLMSGTPEINDDELIALLENARARDSKKNDNTEAIVNIYMKALLVNEEARIREGRPLPAPSPWVIPPRIISEVPPYGYKSAFRTSSLSPIKSLLHEISDFIDEINITDVKEEPKSPMQEPATFTTFEQPDFDEINTAVVKDAQKSSMQETVGASPTWAAEGETNNNQMGIIIKEELKSPMHEPVNTPLTRAVEGETSNNQMDIIIKEEPISPTREPVDIPATLTAAKETNDKEIEVIVKEEPTSPTQELIAMRAARSAARKRREKANSIKTKLLTYWRIAIGHRHSIIFLCPVTEKEAPGYSKKIKEKMDLTTLKRDIESEKITTFDQFQNRLSKMFANAIMFNSAESDIYRFAQEMHNELLEEYSRLNSFHGGRRSSRRFDQVNINTVNSAPNILAKRRARSHR